jgi:hypothetical protein
MVLPALPPGQAMPVLLNLPVVGRVAWGEIED